MATVQVINSLTSKSPKVMALVRAFTFLCLHNNILLHARHVPGVCNGIADPLSWKQMGRFHQLAPEADPLLVPLPRNIWRIRGMELKG